MSAIVKIGLRLVGTTKHITNNNLTKYRQSMCHVKNGFCHIAKNSITPAQKNPARYWKKISAVTKNILWYSTIPFTAFVLYAAIEVKRSPKFWDDVDMFDTVDDETLKYSIIPSKIIESSILFDDGQIEIKTKEDDIFLMNDNTRNLIISEELDANIQEPFPKGKPIPIKIGKFDGLLDNGKLTLKTKEGDTTFTFHHTVTLEVKKTSTTLQDEIAANKKKQREVLPSKIGKFYVLPLPHEMTVKTPESEKNWTAIHCTYNELKEDWSDKPLPSLLDIFPIIGNFSISSVASLKIQEEASDEVYYFKQSVIIECEKKINEHSQNIIFRKKKFPKDKTATRKVYARDILTDKIKTCDLSINGGTVVFKTKNGNKFVVRQIHDVQVFEDGDKTYAYWVPHLKAFES